MAGEIIRMGDSTSHGGTVIEGCLTATYMGKPIALIGHQTSCPKCGGTYPIIEGVSTATFCGKSVAVAGMKTACGAVLIASQFTGTVEQTRGGAEAASRSDGLSTMTAQHGASAMLGASPGDQRAGAQADAVEIEEFYSLTSGDGLPLEHYCYDLFVDAELHTRAAQYAAGRTARVQGGASTRLVTWLKKDSAARQ